MANQPASSVCVCACEELHGAVWLGAGAAFSHRALQHTLGKPVFHFAHTEPVLFQVLPSVAVALVIVFAVQRLPDARQLGRARRSGVGTKFRHCGPDLAPECRSPVRLWRRLGTGRSCLQLTVECLRAFERFGWELFPEVVLQPRMLASLTFFHESSDHCCHISKT